MSKIIDDMISKTVAEVVRDMQIKLVPKFIERGDSLESIADFFEITVEEVRNLIAQKSV